MKKLKTATKQQFKTITRPHMERMTAIQQLIEDETYPNCTTLARLLECTAKTIKNDIEFLRSRFKHSIDFDFYKNGYYYTKKSAPLTLQHASEAEIEGICLIDSACQAMQGTAAEVKARAAFNRLIDSLSNKYAVSKRGWKNIINFRYGAQPIFDSAIFETLFTASANREQVKILYCKAGPDQVPKERIIDPYCLVRRDSDWYIFAYDHGAKGDRTFVPARIKSIELTGKKFRCPRTFTVEKRLRNCFNIVDGDKTYDVKLRFNPYVADYIREKIWSGQENIIELPDAGVELHLKVADLAEVQRWFMAYSGQAVVLHPPQLEQMVMAAAQKILDEQRKLSASREQASESNVVAIDTNTESAAA